LLPIAELAKSIGIAIDRREHMARFTEPELEVRDMAGQLMTLQRRETLELAPAESNCSGTGGVGASCDQ